MRNHSEYSGGETPCNLQPLMKSCTFQMYMPSKTIHSPKHKPKPIQPCPKEYNDVPSTPPSTKKETDTITDTLNLIPTHSYCMQPQLHLFPRKPALKTRKKQTKNNIRTGDIFIKHFPAPPSVSHTPTPYALIAQIPTPHRFPSSTASAPRYLASAN